MSNRLSKYIDFHERYFCISMCFLCALITLFFNKYNLYGDSYYYNLFFDKLAETKFSKVITLQKNILSSSEPIYAILIYTLSFISSKLYVDVFLNTLLTYLITKNLSSVKNRFYVFLITFGNFYYYILISSAERLKVAFIFLLLMIAVRNYFIRVIFFILALLSHLQIILLIPLFSYFLLCKSKKNKYFQVIFIFIIVSMLVLMFREQIVFKLHHYFKESLFYEVVKPVILALLSVALFPKDWRLNFLIHMPLVLSSILVGSNRLVMFSIFGIFFLTVRNSKYSLVFKIILLYLVVKSITYLLSVYYFADGFFYGTKELLRLIW